MKTFLKFLCPIMALVLFQSCKKESTESKVVIDPYTYAAKFNWMEDSIKVDNSAWTKVAKGNLFSWLSQDGKVQKSNFAIYNKRANIKTDFVYAIQKDSVFALKLLSDTVYFLDKNGNSRADLKGQVTLGKDTSLILRNTGASPAISVKYKLEK
ncbi:hypothetical protein SNE26_06700 [Mucilaginibacter sp. cycad4]|uniref:hypothetical protein n=1 Tax=Mucilaginibacter sp. cycad4 TaxID=3342096 RepID=UPI002AAC42FD|nr:hypothetical protein [Mucilaginibacter gossypii]WPV01458.1 hypothetical protein SNE26_06700 [Mucilaginibacter gossypii]